MVKNHCTHSWIGGFVERLVELRPTLGIASAVQYAVMSFHHAAEIEPRRAADIFVLSYPQARSVKPQRARRTKESQAARYRELFGIRLALPASGSDRARGREPAMALR